MALLWPPQNRHLHQGFPPSRYCDGLEPRHKADHHVHQQRQTSGWHHQELQPNQQGHSQDCLWEILQAWVTGLPDLCKAKEHDDDHLPSKIIEGRCTSKTTHLQKWVHLQWGGIRSPHVQDYYASSTIDSVATTQTLRNNLQLLGVSSSLGNAKNYR